MSCMKTVMAFTVVLALGTAPLSFADNVFTGGNGTAWNDALNWDDGVVPPGGDVNVNIYDDFTVDLTSNGMTVGENHLRVGNSELGETATLNIISGSLDVDTTDNSQDIILGRQDLAQSGALGFINQTGGVVVAGDYLKMSSDKDFAAGSLYQISGGSLQILDQMQMGRDDGESTHIEFRVVGSGATSIEVGDIKVEQNLSAQATFSFVIDEFGVTPITVLDELQLGNNEDGDVAGVGDSILSLELSTTAQPPSVITLFDAGRITMDEQFVGLPDDSLIPVSFSGTDRLYRLNYVGGEDVVLTEVIPEPTSVLLLFVSALPVGVVRRRRM